MKFLGITEMIEVIGTVGFPIFVAVWLLWKSDKTEKRTQEILMELNVSIIKLWERLDGTEVNKKWQTK